MQQPPGKFYSGSPEISPLDIPKVVGNLTMGKFSGYDGYCTSTDATLFSSSVPVLSHEKFSLNGKDQVFQSVDDLSSNMSKLHQGTEGISSLINDENEQIGDLLPGNEEELLAGIMDDLDLSGLPDSLEDVVEDYDVFGFGGMELEGDSQGLSGGVSKLCLPDSVVGNGMPHFVFPNGMGTIAGEHPYGEHPSRTLFVRNINSNVEDSELKALFEQYGDIRSMYTACKHRGFVMISYYDIRAARTAMRLLQHKPLRRRKLDIHFSIPKDNPSDKDINQGTLVIFNLDPSVSNEELRKIFGAYGEVKEIRETPHKRHHKFIEFYDVRAAEAALKGLNRSEIAGKRIKLEPSRPGGARRNLMLQLNQDFEQDESRGLRHQVGSPIMNSPPGNWMQFNSPIEHSTLQHMPNSSGFKTFSSTTNNLQPGLASILQPQVPNTIKVPPIGRDKGRGSNVEQFFSNTYLAHGTAFQKPHSLPESRLNHYSRTSPSVSSGSGVETLSGTEFLWGSPKVYAENPHKSAWPMTSANHPLSVGNGHGLPQSSQHGSFPGLSQHHSQHHVGSAPSNIPVERRFGFFSDSSGRSSMNPVSFGGRGLSHNEGSFMVNAGARVGRDTSVALPGKVSVNGSSSFGMMPSSKLNSVALGNGFHSGFSSSVIESLTERGWSRRVENSGNHIDNRKQFQLDLEKIKSGEDTRTTLMIKNIPNKYTSKMLLAAIDENHKGTYDFFYLPIDFKNKCNVGYAFINMLSPSHVIPFYEAFNAKKWEKFNSEKVASVAYARIQGKAALVAHFQNSSLMNEDKRCRPILFNSESSEVSGQIIQENLPSGGLNFQVQQLNGSCSGESPGSPVKVGTPKNWS